MNDCLLLQIPKRELDRLLAYVRDCGYTVETQDVPGDLRLHLSPDCPWYGDGTPVAQDVLVEGRWVHYACLRLPAK